MRLHTTTSDTLGLVLGMEIRVVLEFPKSSLLIKVTGSFGFNEVETGYFICFHVVASLRCTNLLF